MSDYIHNLISDLKHCQEILTTIGNAQPKYTPNTKGILHEIANLMGIHINHLQTIADYQQSSSEATKTPSEGV